MPRGLPITRMSLPQQGFLGPTMNLCVEGVGRLDVERLWQATTTVLPAGSRVPVRPVHGPLDSSALHELPALREPLSDATGEILVLHGPVPAMVFRASRSTMDHAGLVRWATAVCAVLRDELPEPVRPSVLDGPRAFGNVDHRWCRRTVDGTFPELADNLAGRQPTGEWTLSWRQLLALLAAEHGPARIARRTVPAIGRRARRLADLAVVHDVGPMVLTSFDTNAFHATSVYLLGPTEPDAPVSIVMVEGDGRTELTLAWPDGLADRDAADEVLDALCAALCPPEHTEYSRIGPDAPTGTTPADPTRSVVEQFLDRVREQPDAVAVSSTEGDTSYAELARHALVVAAELRSRGAGRETVVGVLAEQTATAVAAIWGVLMAGAAYLPMDPKHPDGRISTLLSDAGSPICLLMRPHHDRDCLPAGCERVVLDDLDFDCRPPDIAEFPAPTDLAYVVYTSGSTGRPKGVEIEHRSLSNYAASSSREHGIGPSTRLPLLCSLSFDLAELSLILPLVVGGTLLVSRDQLNHISLQEILDNGATTLSLTPSHLDLITRLGLRPGAVRTLIVIGEQLTRSVAMRALDMFGPACRLINHYGPAEATVGVSRHFFDPDRDTGAAVPIGMPMDDVTFHLLDAHRRPAAPGETGELYIGGVQLARGYRGRPDLTRERFVRLADGERVYRTGDIVRRLPSGTVEFCARIDDQLKVHGHRIEPAEIAQTLETHVGVTRAVVVARSRAGSADRALCGYVIADADVSMAELRTFLEDRLPGYMVPAVLLRLADIPRSINGKVDVAALPDPFAAKPN